MSDNQKNPVSALFDGLKGLFAKQQAKPPAQSEVPPDAPEATAVRKASTTFSKLQSMQGSAQKADQPAFTRPNLEDQMYQASKGGAEATKAQRRPSSTFTKLQALSASGTGAAGMAPQSAESSASLDKLLDRLDQE